MVLLVGEAHGEYTHPSSSSNFPIDPVTAPSKTRRRAAILIRPGEAIPFFGPIPARRLAWRRVSPRASDHRSSSSSLYSDSSPVHSLGLDAPDQAHSGSSTRDVSPRLGYPPRRAPRRSEAFRHWCDAPLSTLYPPTTSELSSGDSSERLLHSSSHSARPSRKRCKSPVDSLPSSTPVMGSLAPTHADLLPPRKRFRYSYSSEASIEEDTKVDLIETKVDMELGIGDGDDVKDHIEIEPRDVMDDTEEYEADTSAGDTVEVGIDPMSAPIVKEEIVEPAGEDSSNSSGTRDGIVRSFNESYGKQSNLLPYCVEKEEMVVRVVMRHKVPIYSLELRSYYPEASDSSDGPPSQDPYVTTITRWRSRAAAHSSSPSDFPIAPVTTPLGTRRRAAILIRPGEAILLGRPYRTHPDGPRRVMTVRKRVGPLPARRLVWRRVSSRSSGHRPSSFSSPMGSSPVHSLDLDAPDQAHSRSLTRVVSPRLESLAGESSERPLHSSSPSAGPSRKRCRSSADSVPSSTPVTGSLDPTRADLLPPRKRFRDAYSSEASMDEDTKVDPTETEVDMELGTGDRDDVRDRVEIDPRDVRDDIEEYEADISAEDTVEVGIDSRSVPVADEESEEPVEEDSSGTRDGIVRSFEDMPIDLDDVVRDFYHHMSGVRIDRVVEIETVQRRLEADQLIASRERTRMTERIDSLRLENLKVRRDRDDTRRRLRRLESTMTNTRSGMTHPAIEEMINQPMDAALETSRINQDLGLGNGNDNGGGDGNGNGNGNGNENGTGNGNNGGDNDDGTENHNVNGRGDRPVARECTYQDFMKCQPLSFKGTEGVVGLIRWSEKMETVFHISNCPERYQVKYATCTLLDSALTWWNSHKRTIGTDAAYAL
ncbi:hypothetical protein Tco_0060134 [Tanacetum coccineum]